MTQQGQNKTILVIVILTSMLFIGLALMLGINQNVEIREIIKDQFNEQQLVIAESAAHYIEAEFNFLKKELLFLKKEIKPGLFDPDANNDLIRQSFGRIMEGGIFKIDVTDISNQKTYTYTPYGHWLKEDYIESADEIVGDYVDGRNDNIWISYPFSRPTGILLKMVVAVGKDVPKRISFYMNITRFLTPFLKEIRSGKSGYAWLIDHQGMFLFHPLSEFIGKNAFSARQEKHANISYYQINFIQKEQMLKGQKGTGWYYSYWHRGITGKIQKLIAYCPVDVSANNRQKWSIAIVAPISEIENTINRLFVNQAFLLGFIIFIISIGTGMIFFFEARWSKWLAHQVEKRTQQLQRSEERYRSLVESAEDFIFAFDTEGKLLSVNSYTANFFGGTPEDFIGKSLAILFDEQFDQGRQNKIDLVLEKGKSIKDEFEIKIDSHKFWISANYMPLKNESENINAILCIARDITENKNLEKQLVNAEKLASIGTLAAGVAHEINNPLGIILGFSDILIRKTDKNSQAYDDLKTIERQGFHCKEVVENLLSFARIGQNLTQYSDINTCIMDVVKVVRHTLEMNDIDLNLDLNPVLPMVRGDGRQLQQVFLNLINNACAAMKAGGTMNIVSRLETYQNKVKVVVEDNGTGIQEEDLEHIFEPFFTTKPEGEGTGLGLFVSYGIVSKYGGIIECESNARETGDRPTGTRFVIKMPIYKGGE